MNAETMPFKTPCCRSVQNHVLLNSDGTLLLRCGSLTSFGDRCNRPWRVWFDGLVWRIEELKVGGRN